MKSNTETRLQGKSKTTAIILAIILGVVLAGLIYLVVVSANDNSVNAPEELVEVGSAMDNSAIDNSVMIPTDSDNANSGSTTEANGLQNNNMINTQVEEELQTGTNPKFQ